MSTSTQKNFLQEIIEELEKIIVLYGNTEVSIGLVLLSAHGNFVRIKEIYEQLDNGEQQQCVSILETVLLNDSDDIVTAIFHLSCLLGITTREQYVHQLIALVLNSQLPLPEKQFIYWQLIAKIFKSTNLLSFEVDVELRKLYQHIFAGYQQRFLGNCRWIPLQERNRNRIIVMTNQMLGENHAPTKTVVERSFSLKNAFAKDVCIVNTAELPQEPIVMPFFDPFLAKKFDGYDGVTAITFDNNESIPFYQCQNIISNETELTKIIHFVENFRPAFILNIGGSNITADLCSQIVPVATLACSFDMPITEGTFYILARNLCQNDAAQLQECSISRQRIIESQYTYQIDEQPGSCTRQDLHIPVDSFVLAIVGNRLPHEITPEYARELHEFLTRNSKAFIVFIGKLRRYSEFTAQYETFNKQTCHLGFRTDLQAVYDCCDAYLNPPRLGGGFSAVLALSRGLPAFTLDYGDVAYAVGKRYHITDFSNIEAFIVKWFEQADFRAAEQAAAKERARELSNTDGVMQKLLYNIEHSNFFK